MIVCPNCTRTNRKTSVSKVRSDAPADVRWQPDDAIIEELPTGNGQERHPAEIVQSAQQVATEEKSVTEAVEPERHGPMAEQEQHAAVEETAGEPEAEEQAEWEIHAAERERQAEVTDRERQLAAQAAEQHWQAAAQAVEQEREAVAESANHARQQQLECSVDPLVSEAQTDTATAPNDALDVVADAEGDHVPQLAPSLAMSVESWLGMHGAADCAPNFRAEGIETLEEIAFVMQTEGDLAELGVTPEQAALLWPTVVAAQNGELSTVKTTEAVECAESDQFAALGVVPASTPQADADIDPFASLEKELDGPRMPSSLY